MENEMMMEANAKHDGLKAPVTCFSHRGWDVQIYLTQVSPEIFVGHVDIFEGKTKRCCIVLAGPLDVRSAISTLETKSADWVDDWLSRSHTGNTGFSEL
ncbi:hypothetical protein [Variovorax saccharolyticus]|uniref:hypothetical protein n=1 Tax=Variovorax saccharolyticus TaxID=3053516 RepID=UPI002576A078|nr:hypothetical protein [Variovorax sp. J31P216]MDM0029882.1 hypothetical protein [Variovorax sp. J31P216]